jgi:hypothetical protein
VILVRGRYCLVWDRAWGLAGEHTLQVGWQLFPGDWRFARRQRAMEAGDGFALRLLHASGQPLREQALDHVLDHVLDLALDLAQGRHRPPRGWVSLEGRDVAAPHWRLRLRGALPLQALWLLAPEPGYQMVELVAETAGQAVVMRGPGGELDRLALGPEPQQTRLLRIPGRSARKSCP